MTTSTPEGRVEELREELRNKILDIETAVRLTYNEKDSDQMIDKLLNHYTQTLQAERQKRDEMVEAERERVVRVIKKLPRNGSIAPASVYHQEIAHAHNEGYKQNRDRILKALTPPNNTK